MEIAYAMLANYAEVSSDGKLHVLGADFNRIHGQFPLTLGHMNLLAKLIFEQSECDKPYHLSVSFVAPNGDILDPRLEQDINPPLTSDPELKTGMSLVVSISGMRFPQPGRYHVRISIDGQELKELRLFAQEVPRPSNQVPQGGGPNP